MNKETMSYRAQHFYQNYKVRYDHILNQLKSASGSRERAAYVGWLGYCNLGDEILFDAHKKLFSELSFVISEPADDFAHFYMRLKKKSLYKYGFLGGGTLIDNRDYWPKYAKDLLAQGLPVACFGTGVSFGEFKGEDNNIEAIQSEWRNLLSSFRFIGVRGPQSLRQLKALGIENAQIVGDTALALAPDAAPSAADSKEVGICFGMTKSSPIEGDEEVYFAEMASFIRLLLEQGYGVRLLPISKDDLPSNERLLGIVNDSRCEIKRDAYKSFDVYAREVLTCRFFFGQKLHSTIIATMHRVPSVMIGYRAKCRDYMESVRMQDYLMSSEVFTAQRGWMMLKKLEAGEMTIRQELDNQILYYLHLQRELAPKVVEALRQFR